VPLGCLSVCNAQKWEGSARGHSSLSGLPQAKQKHSVGWSGGRSACLSTKVKI